MSWCSARSCSRSRPSTSTVVAVPGDSLPRDPAVPLRRPPDLLRARGGDAPARKPRRRLPRRHALRRLGHRQVVADQRRAAPRGHAARLHPERLRVQPRRGEELVVERIATAEDDDQVPALAPRADDDDSPRIVLSTRRSRNACARRQRDHRPLHHLRPVRGDRHAVRARRRARQAQQRLVELIVALLREPLPVKLLFAFREDYLGKVKQLLADAPELVDQALRLTPPDGRARCRRSSAGRSSATPVTSRASSTLSVAERLCAALADRFGAGDLSLSEVQTVCLRLWQADDPEALLAAKGPQGLLEDYSARRSTRSPRATRRGDRTARPDGHRRPAPATYRRPRI